MWGRAEAGCGGGLGCQRQVAHTPRRLAEAARLGFKQAVVPFSAPEPPEGIRAVRVGTLLDAVVRLGLIENPPIPIGRRRTPEH